MSAEMYEAIVIGAGGMGSAAAYHLARSGARVLVLEQFSRGHARGSSHGETRAIRYYYDRAFYTELMKPAYAEWRRLEEESGKNLLFITGGVLIAPEGHEFVELRRAILEEAGVSFSSLGRIILYLDDFADFIAFDAVCKHYIPAERPALACVQIPRAHPVPGARMCVEAIAVKE